jgi:hypothetical protein
MPMKASWLHRGFFAHLMDEDPPILHAVRDELCKRLHLKSDSLQIAYFPGKSGFKHTCWWREGDTEYAEAQFFAQVSTAHPVLSLGVAVEKGREDAPWPASLSKKQRMTRKTWDWPRLIKHAPDVLARGVVDASSSLKAPVNVRVRSRRSAKRHTTGWETRAFSFLKDRWFERHVGNSDAPRIIKHFRELDGYPDAWAIVHFALDLAPSDVEGMKPSKVADVLMAFDGIRSTLRP